MPDILADLLYPIYLVAAVAALYALVMAGLTIAFLVRTWDDENGRAP